MNKNCFVIDCDGYAPDYVLISVNGCGVGTCGEYSTRINLVMNRVMYVPMITLRHDGVRNGWVVERMVPHMNDPELDQPDELAFIASDLFESET